MMFNQFVIMQRMLDFNLFNSLKFVWTTGWSAWSDAHLVGWCLPLLIFPCTRKSRSSLLAPAHQGGPRKRVVKRLCVCVRWVGVDLHINFRPHCSTTYVDSACCYRRIVWSVGRSVCHTSEPCKNGWTDRDGVWVVGSYGPKESS